MGWRGFCNFAGIMETRTDYNQRWMMALVVAIYAFTFIPWLGLTLFNSKGEPREAIVALSMLQSGDWVLPVSYGGDIPYKPPFLAWCIALASYLCGGVTEVASRLPSALAMMALGLTTAWFLRREQGGRVALVTALILASAIEPWRAATACRVDMVLTAFMVGSLVSLYCWVERGSRWAPFWSVLWISGAVLTKGIVGMGLPCLVVWVYGLLRGRRFWRLTLGLAAIGITGCVLPAMWYIAAYQQGGEGFVSLMLEENIGRLTGTMSYDSHVHPWWYNFITVLTGMLRYTMLALMALFAARYRRLRDLCHWTSLSPERLFSLVATLIIFIFYCIPKSKRSVYLLPIYPFLAYFVTLLIIWLWQRSRGLLKAYGRVIGSLAILLPLALCILPMISLKGKSAVYSLYADSIDANPVAIVLMIVALGAGVVAWRQLGRARSWFRAAGLSLIPTLAILWLLSGGVLPTVLNAKSDRPLAAEIEQLAPEGPVYSYITTPMLRCYTINYYLGDRLREWCPASVAASGYLLIPANDVEVWQKQYGRSFELQEVAPWSGISHKSCDLRQPIALYRFHRLQ